MTQSAQLSNLKKEADRTNNLVNDQQIVNGLLRELAGQQSADIRESLVHKSLGRQNVGDENLIRLIEVLINQKFYAEAKSAFEYGNNNNGYFKVLQARLAFIESDYANAVVNWKIATEMLPRLIVPDYFKFLEACEKTDEIKLFQTITEEMFSSLSGLSETQVRRLAVILHRNQQTEKARIALETLVAKEDFSTYLIIASINNAVGHHDTALSTINEAIDRFSTRTAGLEADEQQRLYHCKLKILLDICEWEEAIALSKHLIKLHPNYFPAYQLWLRAIRGSCDHKAHLTALSVTYEIFHDQHPELVVPYCRELELDGQPERALTLLEDANLNQTGFLTHLLKKYLRDGLFDKFTLAVNSNQLPKEQRVAILSDYFLHCVRLGSYDNLSEIVSTIMNTHCNCMKEQREINAFRNHLVHLHGILVSESVDPSLVLCENQKKNLLREIEPHLPNSLVTSTVPFSNKSLWTELIYSDFTQHTNTTEFVAHTFDSYFKALENHPHVFTETYESPDQAQSLASYLKERINRQQPTSMIRLGDGEGNYLEYPDFIEHHQSEDQRFIQRVWWGDTNLSKADTKQQNQTLEDFHNSVKNADIIGIPPVRRLLRTFDPLLLGNGELNSNTRGLISVAHSVCTLNKKEKIFTSCHVHTDLELWNCYTEIFESLQSISIISCHEQLEDYVRNTFGIKSVRSYTIPAESRFQRMFDQESGIDHFPTYFNHLTSRIPSISKGQVFLVGAGFLGKIYCDLIKRNGGIALDVGSLMDRWTGFQTRFNSELDVTCQGLRYPNRVA